MASPFRPSTANASRPSFAKPAEVLGLIAYPLASGVSSVLATESGIVRTSQAPTAQSRRAWLTQMWVSPVNLFAKLGESKDIGLDVSAVTEADRQTLIRFGVDRYVKRHGLFGTPEECAARARTIRAAGVDEVAHLLDFGVPFDTVLDHMSYLDQF